jgi:hypothetical protein
MSEIEPTNEPTNPLFDPLAPTPKEAHFLNGIPEHDRRKTWENIFREEKIQATEENK